MSHVYTHVSKRRYKTIGWGSYIAAMVKELKQLNNGAMKGKHVVVPIDPSQLTIFEKRATLDEVNLIKKKRNGDIKGRTCANGAK